MGSEDPIASPDEQPVHPATVPPFQMTRTKATFCLVRRCVADGACDPGTPEGPLPLDREGYDDLPMGLATFALGQQLAAWVGEGARLCSEAEWEFAATSAGQPWTYPWGDELTCSRIHWARPGEEEGSPIPQGCGPRCNLSSWCPVCGKPDGSSAQGVCDLAGNSGEWVADHYHPSYVGAPIDGSPWIDPQPGADRVVRSGGVEPRTLRSARRAHQPEDSYDATAIRLCRSRR